MDLSGLRHFISVLLVNVSGGGGGEGRERTQIFCNKYNCRKYSDMYFVYTILKAVSYSTDCSRYY